MVGSLRRGLDDAAYDLDRLAAARRLGDWTFAQFAHHVSGSVAEVGAGIGTYSERILARGVDELLLLEPEEPSAAILEARFRDDPRVTVARQSLPESAELRKRAGALDLVLCQNVLEHIEDDRAAVDAMAAALRPGGRLFVLVPAHPRLFGSLDRAYEHHRRYTRSRLRTLASGSGLRIHEVRSFNLLGVPGWIASNVRGARAINGTALRLYDRILTVWRPVEDRLRLPVGLSLLLDAERPA